MKNTIYLKKLQIYKESHVTLKEYLKVTGDFPFEKIDFKLYEAIMNFRKNLLSKLEENSNKCADKEYLLFTKRLNEKDIVSFFEEATNGYINLFNEFVKVANKVKENMNSEYKKYEN